MSTNIETPAVQTARNNLHDVAHFKASKEFDRYWIPYFTKRRDDAVDQMLNGEALGRDEYLVQLAIYKENRDALLRMDIDEREALKLVSEFNSKQSAAQ